MTCYLLSLRGDSALHGEAFSVKVGTKGVNSGVVGIHTLKEAGEREVTTDREGETQEVRGNHCSRVITPSIS